jgi:hypothetical protein
LLGSSSEAKLDIHSWLRSGHDERFRLAAVVSRYKAFLVTDEFINSEKRRFFFLFKRVMFRKDEKTTSQVKFWEIIYHVQRLEKKKVN